MEQLSKLMPLDEISVSVFENPDFETNTMITEIGEISMPLIGKIKISGLTLEEAENVIEAKYSDGFIKSPCVLIRVVKRAQEQVTVLGNVQNQRVIEFDSNRGLTLTEALGKANGPTLKADISKIILTSIDANGQPQSKQIDMKVIIQGKTKDIQLQNGDLIYVKESMF
ncbi:MAG: polysaccharide biosynthesis/export family protein [Puniceicoccales bacterium]|jgi:polysaccharide export outer membrane protein|nr:polysaccharide biosynthesis/export family protein [Puniceicoccales bacterium]